MMTTPGTAHDRAQIVAAKKQRQASRIAEAASAGIKVLLVKVLLLGIVDAISVYALFVLFIKQDWLVFGLVLLVTIVVNWVYFRVKGLPAKYLTPGLIFLIICQIFVVG